MKVQRCKLVLLIGWIGTLFTAAASAEGGPEFNIEGPRIFGGDASLSWGSLKLIGGVGWESVAIGRDTVTGEPLTGAPNQPMVINEGAWLRQTWKFNEASVWVGAGAQAHGDFGLSGGSGAVADEKGGLFGFVQAGVARDRRQKNDHGTLSGHFVEVFVEGGPSFLSVRSTDYWKLSAASTLYLPLWDLEGERQLFSGVLAVRANAQWISGASVPLFRLEPTEVRGYESLYDTRFRSVVTTELRLGLPSLWGTKDLVPVMIVFADAGRSQGYNNTSAASDRGVWLASVGAGFGLSILGLTTPTVSVALPLLEEKSLWWTANFNLRF